MPKHHRGSATKQTGLRRPQPEGRQGFAAAGRRCSSSSMLCHRLLVAPCRPTPDPWRTACQEFCHGLLGSKVRVLLFVQWPETWMCASGNTGRLGSLLARSKKYLYTDGGGYRSPGHSLSPLSHLMLVRPLPPLLRPILPLILPGPSELARCRVGVAGKVGSRHVRHPVGDLETPDQPNAGPGRRECFWWHK